MVNEFGINIILPCVMAMDKTYINMAGWLLMESVTLSHGLLKHAVRRLPIAMRILGYFNHSTPPHLPSPSEQHAELNSPAALPNGTMLVKDPLQHDLNVMWPTYLLSEAHMQIQLILEKNRVFEIAELWLLMEFTLQWEDSFRCVSPLCTIYQRRH